ncbi:MAG: PEP-CTERM sorting domain-containing protein [Planctomycetaceae bacterium]
MRSLPLLLTILVSAASGQTAHAALVHTIDFSDGSMWSVTTTLIGGAADGGSGVINGGDGLRADKVSNPGGILVEATLIGTIDTTGFSNLELFFSNSGAGTKEFDAIFGTSGDGFDITSTEGVSFNTIGATGAFLTSLNAGNAWNPTNAATAGQDLTFDASVNNSAITSLVIRLQVNENVEVIDLTGFTIQGTPEPGSMALMGVGLLGAFGVRRRRKNVSTD